MAETAFYVVGIALVVIALVLSAVGLRWERFPGSRAVFGGIVAVFAVLVVGAGAFAWIQAEDEQREHAAEHAAERAAAAEERAAALRGEVAGAEGTPEEADGAQVFDAAGCGGCHTLAAAGTSAGVGPDLDETLPGQTPAFIEESIVDPNTEIAQGFQPGLMPDTYGDQLSDEELEALVDFLAQSVSQ